MVELVVVALSASMAEQPEIFQLLIALSCGSSLRTACIRKKPF
jgi:hypothetical protein